MRPALSRDIRVIESSLHLWVGIQKSKPGRTRRSLTNIASTLQAAPKEGYRDTRTIVVDYARGRRVAMLAGMPDRKEEVEAKDLIFHKGWYEPSIYSQEAVKMREEILWSLADVRTTSWVSGAHVTAVPRPDARISQDPPPPHKDMEHRKDTVDGDRTHHTGAERDQASGRGRAAGVPPTSQLVTTHAGHFISISPMRFTDGWRQTSRGYESCHEQHGRNTGGQLSLVQLHRPQRRRGGRGASTGGRRNRRKMHPAAHRRLQHRASGCNTRPMCWCRTRPTATHHRSLPRIPWMMQVHAP